MAVRRQVEFDVYWCKKHKVLGVKPMCSRCVDLNMCNQHNLVILAKDDIEKE